MGGGYISLSLWQHMHALAPTHAPRHSAVHHIPANTEYLSGSRAGFKVAEVPQEGQNFTEHCYVHTQLF